jgi:hypothetical protein
MTSVTDASLTPREAISDPGFDAMLDDLAALVAREHANVVDEGALRKRAELAADGLVVYVTHLLAELDQARADRDRLEGVANEIAALLARERAERDNADEIARVAVERLEAEAAWRRRFGSATRRERRRLLRDRA